MMRVLSIVAIAPAAATAFFFVMWRWFDWWRKHPLAAYAMIVALLGGFTAAVMIWREEVLAVQLALPLPLAVVGWIAIVIAHVLAIVADRQLGWHVRSFAPFFERDGSIKLITNGAYGIVRHPLYL